MDIEDGKGAIMSRRSALKTTGGIALLLSQAALLERVALTPARPAWAASFSDIQFSIGQFMPPSTYAGVNTYNDGAGAVTASFGPIYSLFTPIKLTRTPTQADKTTLANALGQIEANFDASPSGLLIVSVSYGLPRAAAAANPSFYEFHTRINPDPSMVMGFVDQMTNSSAPHADEFTNGGGPAFVNNVFQGTNAATRCACSGPPAPPAGPRCTSAWTDPASTAWTCPPSRPTPTCLASRSPYPPGPASSSSSSPSSCRPPPSSKQMRVSQASQDLFAQFGQPNDPNGESGGIQFSDNGLERFITATRRQNFLVPPRRNRAFPLIELT